MRRPQTAATAVGLAVGVAAISTSPILVRVAQLPAFALAFWRCLAGALLLAPFAVRGGRPARGELRQLAGSGTLLALHFACFNASLAFTTVASATLLVSMSPLFVGLGAARFLGEAPSRRGWLGIWLATGGAVVVALGDLGAVRLGARALVGDLLAFAGALLIAGYLLIGRSARRRLPVAIYGAAVYGAAAVVLLPLCLATGAPLGGYRAGSWLALAAVVAGPQLLGHTVFNGLLSTLTAATVAVVILLEPVGATVLAWWLFREVPAGLFWVGAPLVLAGVWLATAQPPPAPGRPGPPPAPDGAAAPG